MKGIRTFAVWVIAVTIAAITGACMGQMTSCVAHAETRVRDMKSRDAVFVTERTCKGDAVLCAKEMWFNGDWSGVLLCRAGQCVRFESIFKEK